MFVASLPTSDVRLFYHKSGKSMQLVLTSFFKNFFLHHLVSYCKKAPGKTGAVEGLILGAKKSHGLIKLGAERVHALLEGVDLRLELVDLALGLPCAALRT